MASPKIEDAVQHLLAFVAATRELDAENLIRLSKRLAVECSNRFGRTGYGELWATAVRIVSDEVRAREQANDVGPTKMVTAWCQRWVWRHDRVKGYSLHSSREDACNYRDNEVYRSVFTEFVGDPYRVRVPTTLPLDHAAQVLYRCQSKAIPGTDTAPPGWDRVYE